MSVRLRRAGTASRSGLRRSLAAAALCASALWGAYAQAETPVAGAQALPPEVTDLLEASPVPKLSQGPGERYLLLVHERELLQSEQLAQPVVSVAGMKINPRTYSRHAPIAYHALTLIDLESGRRSELDVPDGATLGFPSWSPDGSRFAFTATHEDGVELWIGDPADASVRRLVGRRLNGTLSAPCNWMPDGSELLCRLVDGEKRPVPAAAAGGANPMTAPTLMRSRSQQQVLDAGFVRHLVESQLTLVDADTGDRRAVGEPVAVSSAEPAPGGAFILVSRLVAPYPQVSGVDDLKSVTEVWDRSGELRKSMAETAGAPRAVQWHASMPATLLWVEGGDDGDRVMMQPSPYEDAPREFFATPHRYAGLRVVEGQRATVITEYDASRRVRRHWLAEPGSRPRALAEGSIDGASSAFGRPVLRTNRWGKEVVAAHDGGVFLRGRSRHADGGARNHLDHVDLASLEAERLWESDGASTEIVQGLLSADGNKILTRRETSSEPPNYFVHGPAGTERLTAYQHPAPGLKEARRVALRYERPDGLGLSANLYLPPRNESAEPPPLIIWAYPRVYGDGTQNVSSVSQEQFPSFERAFKLFFVLAGFAVLDEVSMPIVGNAATANDSFVEQVITNAHAAIEAARETGFVDADRVGVAGHSYGAFMVANLLAHSDLFTAGAALSGAYNRTLTPFGFQTERRSLWEARETYLEMSPFMYSNRIREPLLLVHGMLDENAGTPPIQSIQFYEAIRHNGGNADILLLPREGHSYRGRESVLATAATMLEFFETHLKRRDTQARGAPLTASTDGGQNGEEIVR